MYISNYYLLDGVVLYFIFDYVDFRLIFFCIFYSTPTGSPT